MQYKYKEIKKGDYLDVLLRSKQTVFSTKDIILLWQASNINAVQVRLNYYVKNNKLIHLRRGIYAKDQNYNKYELATKILRPSYVSFETVLGASGITFQYYNKIFIASYATREITCDAQKYCFQRINKNILINPKGIDQSNGYSIATKERAFLDAIYKNKKYYFDNLSPLDWDKVFDILLIYESKIMEKRVNKYYQDYKKLC
ncbi:MAG: hypothetical protein ABH888_02255 [Patescibacteria group bacterium]